MTGIPLHPVHSVAHRRTFDESITIAGPIVLIVHLCDPSTPR
jgi:hypothetical protein